MPTIVVMHLLDRKEPLPVHSAVCDIFKSQPCPVYQYCESVS